MTKRYRRELDALPATYAAALATRIDPLAEAIANAITGPLRVVGSGGSFSGAAFCARIHEFYTGQIARPVTPLELLRTRELSGAGIIALSASGRNRDICAAFERAAVQEVRPLIGLSLAIDSPLSALGKRYAYSDVVSFPLPIATDGFLAVNSLFATVVLVVRAYREVIGTASQLPSTLEDLLAFARWPNFLLDRRSWANVLSRQTISVLFSPTLAAAAVDLESRFVEGALGNLHIADWRNFAHGRHHWLAKRPEETGIIALIGADDRDLAARTLGLVPKAVARVEASISGGEDEQALCGLYVALCLTEIAGSLTGIDPGKPGVPIFGRKIYHLGPRAKLPGLRERAREAAIRRKAVARASSQHQREDDAIAVAVDRVRQRFRETKFAAVVFDYDGTLCDRRERYVPLRSEVATHLKKLAAAGFMIGVATGRGRSSGKALRDALPQALWARVVVGYYNGAVVAPLTVTELNIEPVSGALADKIAGSLAKERFQGATIEVRRHQVTLSLPKSARPENFVRRVAELVASIDSAASVCCSSHSIDIVLDGASKLAVVDAVRRQVGPDSAILRIGDKGRWPGNDFKLLHDPFGLSVDEVSEDLDACWNLAPSGVLGLQATLYYLSRLTLTDAPWARFSP